MADKPFPLTAETIDDLRGQVDELIRQLFEERIGGANLGDVFAITGEVLTLVVNTDGGLEKSSNALQVKPSSTGGLETATAGTGIKLKSGSGLTVDADGLYISQSAALTGTIAWDQEIADGATGYKACTVTGASLGDPAAAGLTYINEQEWVLTAVVTATNTVTACLTNNTGSSQSVSGTLTCIVWAQ